MEFGYETVKIPYTYIGSYLPDFVIQGNIFVECKGYFRPEDKRKLKAVKTSNPELDIRLLFYAHNKKNIKWAEKNSFTWAVSQIPEEWLTCSIKKPSTSSTSL